MGNAAPAGSGVRREPVTDGLGLDQAVTEDERVHAVLGPARPRSAPWLTSGRLPAGGTGYAGCISSFFALPGVKAPNDTFGSALLS
ncbi:hypothetical protein GCM10010430_04920 [Kitasatospora cystarginea]|uniref:Uncharacterized protein n=1 Tax=Kitasatospora cystarginea TaxID=58350 RepID=A0ABN3DE04_9ACTN